MKKCLLAATLILGFFVAAQHVEAVDVYVGMNDYGDGKVYVLTDTIRDITFKGNSGFSVQVKLLRGGTQQVYPPWYFFRIYDQWCISTSLDDYQIPTPVTGILLKVAETANQYR